MADGFVQVPPDSTGKLIDTNEITTTVGLVERQRVAIPDTLTISGDTLTQILIEQRVQNLLLSQGLNVLDGIDSLRNDVSNIVALTAAPSTPGGSTLQVQYNNAGSFGGMSGTSWDNTNLALTITGATVTASNPILNLKQTWNNAAVTFTGIVFNAIDTAATNQSLLLDLQHNSSSALNVDKFGDMLCGNVTTMGANTIAGATVRSALGGNGSGGWMSINNGIQTHSTGYFAFSSTFDAAGGPDTGISRSAAGVIALGNGTQGDGSATILAKTKAGAPTTSDVPSGTWVLIRDTTNATTKLYYNNAGTLQTVALT